MQRVAIGMAVIATAPLILLAEEQLKMDTITISAIIINIKRR